MNRGVKKWLRLAPLMLAAANWTFAGAVLPAAAKEGADTEAPESVEGQLVFAKCTEYVNIRSGADTDHEVTAKIYNYEAATVEKQVEDWYLIRSGNAYGYAKAEYFATGEEAEEIAEKVAYRVAVVHPEELNVRTQPNEECEVLTSAGKNDELEVVDWSGDWMKVALGGDVYGYVNAYYVDYKVYYPEAETVEEEQARLRAEREASGVWDDVSEENAGEPEYTETAPEYVETEPEYVETEPEYNEPEYTETEPTYKEPEYVETEPEYAETEPEYVETEPEYTETEPEYVETEPEYTETEPEYVETEPEYAETEPEYVETEPEYAETEPEYVETEPEYAETEPEYVETEPEYVEPEPVSGTGQEIANFAVQYVGNPYVWGGTSLTDGADCSGFAQAVFANFGIGLARTAESQAYGGTSVSLDSLLPGDLVFYNSTGIIDHVAIYIGNGQIVHAANSSKGIIISSAWYATPVSASRYW